MPFQPSAYSYGDVYGAGAKTTTAQCADAQAKVALWKSRVGKKLYPKAQTHVNEWEAKVKVLCSAAEKEQSQLDNLLTMPGYDPASGGDTSDSAGGLPLPLLAIGGLGLLAVVGLVAVKMRRKAA